MDEDGQPTSSPLDTWNWYSLDDVLNPNTGLRSITSTAVNDIG
jgi:hypothetical protein